MLKTKTRDEWCRMMEGTEVCFAPVFTITDAHDHPYMAARKVFVSRQGVTQPAPAPRFSRTPSSIRDSETVDIQSLTHAWREKPSLARAFSSEVDTGSRKENASKQKMRASVPIPSERKRLSCHDSEVRIPSQRPQS